jgi:peptidoglycan/xylan/chitin deacetylase (PgdA/CDA1 family)
LNIKKIIVPFLYWPYKLKNNFSKLFFKKFNLRVLIYHDIDNIECFKKQILSLKKNWNFITPYDFEKVINGERNLSKDSLLLTFDDGFISNKYVALDFLGIQNIKAIFFIIKNFAEINNEISWKNFVCTNIIPNLKNNHVQSSCKNMNWDDLSLLIENGHTIGAHTANHLNLKKSLNISLHNEIIESALFMENKLNIKIKHFAYPFGNLESISNEAVSTARLKFQFIHTGFRKNNLKNKNSFCIKREAIALTDSNFYIASVLEGALDFFYQKQIKIYEKWI